jgi:hypothetical protein
MNSQELEAAEKIYISLLQHERQKDEQPTFTNGETTLNGPTILEKKEEEEQREIYNYSGDEHKRIQTYTKIRHRRGRYRKNAIRDRMQLFAQDLEAKGFIFGNKFTQQELRYWIIALDLAHDKLTINHYFERLVITGYFILKQGKFTFCGSRRAGQLSLITPEKIMGSLRACLHTDHRIKRRSY